ncbi:hypothetical protein CFP56_027270 [Quercus suber]|uniref:Uncharacterized protein n=1 Tax=Quercus suber TaxID=58331 RepID=A0AAW0JYF7_QUESU
MERKKKIEKTVMLLPPSNPVPSTDSVAPQFRMNKQQSFKNFSGIFYPNIDPTVCQIGTLHKTRRITQTIMRKEDQDQSQRKQPIWLVMDSAVERNRHEPESSSPKGKL